MYITEESISSERVPPGWTMTTHTILFLSNGKSLCRMYHLRPDCRVHNLLKDEGIEIVIVSYSNY